MIKRFIIRCVSKKFKGVQKLKPQKVEVRREFLTDKQIKLRQKTISDQNIRDTIGTQEFGKFSARGIEELRGESVAINLANRKFFKTFGSELKSSRKKTAIGIKGKKLKIKTPTSPTFKQIKAGVIKGSNLPTSKSILKFAKGKGGIKAYKSADLAANKIYTKTMKRFVGKEKRSQFKTITKSTFTPPTGFGGERAAQAQRTLSQGYTPKGWYSGYEKTGKISKRHSNWLDMQAKKKKK